MEEATKDAFLEMLTHDREWAKGVFGTPRLGAGVARRSGYPIPGFLGEIALKVGVKEQVDDLTQAIDTVQNIDKIDCIDKDFKLYLLTILKNDTDWFVKSASDTGYSKLIRPQREVCEQLERGLEEIEDVPECR